MTTLDAAWEREVRLSRLVITLGDDSYIEGVGVNVWVIIHHLANNLGEEALLAMYPQLTKADIRACSLFVYLRAIKKM